MRQYNRTEQNQFHAKMSIKYVLVFFFAMVRCSNSSSNSSIINVIKMWIEHWNKRIRNLVQTQAQVQFYHFRWIMNLNFIEIMNSFVYYYYRFYLFFAIFFLTHAMPRKLERMQTHTHTLTHIQNVRTKTSICCDDSQHTPTERIQIQIQLHWLIKIFIKLILDAEWKAKTTNK